MPRYMVERSFKPPLSVPANSSGAATCQVIVGRNADVGVTWLHSYVAGNGDKTYCIYDGPNPEAIQKAAECNGLPVDSISPVTVLDPFFNH